jgi:DNA-binding NarL/FixJ family response regulator
MRKLRVLIVDDNEAFLNASRDFVEEFCPAEVVACERCAEAAPARVGTLRPDVVLMDMVLPGINGMAGAARIKSLPHPPAVVLISLQSPAGYWLSEGALPIDGFVSKQEFCAQIPPILQALHDARCATASGEACGQ